MNDAEWGEFLVRVREVGGAWIREWASPPPERGKIAREILETDLALFYDKANEVVRLLGILYEVVDVGERDWVGAVRVREP